MSVCPYQKHIRSQKICEQSEQFPRRGQNLYKYLTRHCQNYQQILKVVLLSEEASCFCLNLSELFLDIVQLEHKVDNEIGLHTHPLPPPPPTHHKNLFTSSRHIRRLRFGIKAFLRLRNQTMGKTLWTKFNIHASVIWTYNFLNHKTYKFCTDTSILNFC